MEINNIKCVMIFDESLPVGVIANTAAILGASLGKADPDVVGITPVDMDGNEHSGLPILKSDSDTIQDIRKKALNKLTGNLSLLR